MAGEWIKLRTDLIDDTDVMQLADLLNVDDVKMVGALAVFWGWADGQTTDGKKVKTTFARIDEKVKISGFSEKLIEIGWLSGKDWAVNIPHFERHNGQSAKRRIQANRRVAEHRAKKSNAPCNGDSNAPCNDDVVTKSVTREDKNKRRKEKKNKEIFIESIYQAYPKKVGKGAAVTSIGKALKNFEDPNELLEAVRKYAKLRAGEDAKFTPNPSTWFNQMRWMDDAVPSGTANATVKPGRIEPPREMVKAAYEAAWPKEDCPRIPPFDSSMLYWQFCDDDRWKLTEAHPPLKEFLTKPTT